MKAVITSDGSEQLALKNIAPALDVPFMNIMEWDKLWGNPLEPEKGAKPECLIIKGFFVQDYSALARMQRMMGDLLQNYNPKCSRAEKVIILWGGSDIIQMWGFRQKCHKYEAKIFGDMRSNRFVHVPVSQQQKDELKKLLDFKATRPLPTPARRLFERMPLPKTRTVAVYMPTYRREFYRDELIFDVARAMPDTKFIFYHWMFAVGPAGESEFPLLDNVEYRYHLARGQYEHLIRESSVVLRIPRHEGLSGGSADFLMAGRPVITCHNMPHCVAAFPDGGFDDPGKRKNSIERIKNKLESSNSNVSEKTRRWYLDNLDPAKYKERLNERIAKTWPEFQL